MEFSKTTSITLNVQPGETYIFTALWDSDHVYLRPTTLSPAETAKLAFKEELLNFRQDHLHLAG